MNQKSESMTHSSKISASESPTLLKLYQRSCQLHRKPMERIGEGVRSKQNELIRKHHEAKSNIENVAGVGGGITLWPAMDSMRLTQGEGITLAISSAFIIGICVVLFKHLHSGSRTPPFIKPKSTIPIIISLDPIISTLQLYSLKMREFNSENLLQLESKETLSQSLKLWHREFQILYVS